MTAWLWQVMLHSSVVGLLFFAWARRFDIPPGETRRRLLVLVLVLPLFTAAVPGRSQPAFRELAWFDGGRLLGLDLGVWGLRGGHLVAAVGLLAICVTLYQEVFPSFRRPRGSARDVPPGILEEVRSERGWEAAEVEVVENGGMGAGMTGTFRRPRLLLARELIDRLDPEELAAVVRHEKAHHRRWHWIEQHLLFGARIVQAHNPVALWAFREYCVEIEIDCDRRAVEGRDPTPLVRALLDLYDETARADVGSRHVLKRRVEALRNGEGSRESSPFADLPGPSLVLAGGLLALFLPWLI